MITAYYGVFDSKLKKLKEKLKKELQETKEKRNKKLIKDFLKEAKQLRNILKKIGNNHKISCPNCKHEFNP